MPAPRLLLCLLLSAVLFTACGKKDADTSKQTSDAKAPAAAQGAKTLVFCSEGSPEGFDPGQYTTGTTFDAAAEPVYNRLTEFERGTTTVKPGVAEKWDVSADGKTITFNLRKGVKFHTTDFFKPTRELNADDVIFTFERMLKKDNPFNKAALKGFPYAESMEMPNSVKAIEKVDGLTVRFVLNKPEAPFIANVAMPFASIMSKEYADQLLKDGKPENLNLAPLGTGPFMFKSYQKDSQIRYEAFKDYWGGKQPIDKLIFAITTDASVRMQKLKTGECHVTAYPRPADIAGLKADTRLNVLGQEGLNVGYLAFNVEHKPLDNKLVREALSLAINKTAIIEAVYQGAGQAATNYIPPTMWSYNKGVKDIPYDTAKAKELLTKAGLPDGFEISLWAMPVQRPYNPNAKQMAEIIQADWAKIGVRAKIVSFEWGEYIKRSKEGQHDALLLGWTGDNGDPDNFAANLLTCEAVKNGENRARWCNKTFDEAILKARSNNDMQVRTAEYMKSQEIFKQEMPWVTIAHSYQYQPIRKEVSGFKMSPFALNNFTDVDIK
ncbi:MAG: ABC transporter substrate-binding protein [Burkholderiales bacterium]